MSASTTTAGAVPGPAKDQRIAKALGRRRHRSNILVKVLCVLCHRDRPAAAGIDPVHAVLARRRRVVARRVHQHDETTGVEWRIAQRHRRNADPDRCRHADRDTDRTLVGTYLAEYGHHSVLANCVRFVSDVLLSAPSILIGLFIYELCVQPFGGFSGIAGCLALAVIVIPIVDARQRTCCNSSHRACGKRRWH